MDPPNSCGSNGSLMNYRSTLNNSGLFHTDIGALSGLFSNDLQGDDDDDLLIDSTFSKCRSRDRNVMKRSADTLSVISRDRKRHESDGGTSSFSEEVGPSKRARISPTPSDDQKKNSRQNHSEIEKRRRDKMNTYINELATMIPSCMNMARKMDKLTVLRLAVQHIRSLQGCLSTSFPVHKPSVLNDDEIKKLVLGSVGDDGFLFVVDSGRGKILFVSETVRKILCYTQNDLFGQSLFDIVHPKDIAKVKEQMSSADLNPRERLIDPRTMLPLNNSDANLQLQNFLKSSPGSRRSFFCRMKVKSIKDEFKDEHNRMGKRRAGSQSGQTTGTGMDRKYAVVQCTGYLKTWPFTKELVANDIKLEENIGGGNDPCMSCLVAVGRVQPSITSAIDDALLRRSSRVEGVEFVARHAPDGKFSFVDQRVTPMTHYLPQEIVGSSIYEHIHYNDIPEISEAHRRALRLGEEVQLNQFRFRAKDGKFLRVQASWKRFRNPWTKEIDYLVARYFICVPPSIPEDSKIDALNMCTMPEGQLNFFGHHVPGTSITAPGCIGDIQRVISGPAEASKIGQQIADEEIRFANGNGGPSSDSSCNTSPLSALLQSTNGNNSPLASLNTPSQSPINISNGVSDMVDDFDVTAVMGEEEQSSVLSDASHIVNYNSPTPSMSSSMLHSPRERQISQNCNNHLEGSVNQPSSYSANDYNDEAAMAVIMSLLEADAGLGGPVDFSGLPWSLS